MTNYWHIILIHLIFLALKITISDNIHVKNFESSALYFKLNRTASTLPKSVVHHSKRKLFRPPRHNNSSYKMRYSSVGIGILSSSPSSSTLMQQPSRRPSSIYHNFLSAENGKLYNQEPSKVVATEAIVVGFAGISNTMLNWSHPIMDEKSTIRKRTPANDIVSKNISLVLENLLKSYENSQLPTHNEGVPTIVKTNILIRSMGPVSELDMDYSMDCYFRQYWRDKRLSFRSPIKSLSLSIKMLERIWRPDTYFYNGKQSHVHTITVPNKLLRLSQDGDILYSMRLTIKASCPMELQNFPMDRQSCPLILGSYAYASKQLIYEWQSSDSVDFVPGMTLSQFDLKSFNQSNFTFIRREGEFSVLQVSFNLQRNTGYFLIQVYVPCILIVVLSWVSFWIHREATSDRVGLGITTVLTLSTISLDSRTDLPKVKYATALDWFLLSCFFYCIATLLEFAGVHYFTKVGSGEIPLDEDEWEDIADTVNDLHITTLTDSPQLLKAARRRSSLICPIYNDSTHMFKATASHLSTMERTTQTDTPKAPKWKQLWLCFLGDDKFRRQRQREATGQKGSGRHVNSVSLIDRTARVMFPMTFIALNILYWLVYVTYQDEFAWLKYNPK